MDSYNLYLFNHKLKSDKNIRDICFKIKDILPQWLNKNINYYDSVFIDWCNDNQDIFLLIVNNLLMVNAEYITITLEIIQGNNPIVIINKYQIHMYKLKWIKRHVLRKVLNALRNINTLSDTEDKEITCNVQDNSNFVSDIKSLGLSLRTYNTLIRNNLYTIAQLKTLTYKQLINIRGFGDGSITEIERALGIQYKRPGF